MGEQGSWFVNAQIHGTHEIRVVFDGPPARDMPTFVELQDHAGRPIQAGQWRERSDGYWELVIPIRPMNS